MGGSVKDSEHASGRGQDIPGGGRPTGAARPSAEPSAIARLLHEISWEGNARRYRDGAPGRENVLTAEVFAALDFLPREAFLGGVIRGAHGATERVKAAVAAAVEDARVTVLPGDIQPRWMDGIPTPWRVQPDVLIETADVCCLVEAKRIRPSSFQRGQLLRTLLALRTRADGRTPLLLLVLGQPPPVAVAGAGRLHLDTAVQRSLDTLTDQRENKDLARLAADGLAWTTWTEITEVVHRRAGEHGGESDSVRASLSRLAQSVSDSVQRHA